MNYTTILQKIKAGILNSVVQAPFYRNAITNFVVRLLPGNRKSVEGSVEVPFLPVLEHKIHYNLLKD